MQVNYNYLPQQFSDVDDYFEELRELVRSGEFTLGPFVDRFEKKFASYIGVKQVIAVNNGTDALILSLKTAGIGSGDEVITVANTFYATVGAIVAVGAFPRFVDCDDRYNIDVSRIESAINRNTKAIIPVHWAGCPCDINEVLQIARKHNLKVIEDACPAVGATVDGKFCGTFGDINAFSMHPLKPLNVWGDGGMVATNDDKMAQWLRCYRNHGMVDRDHIDIWGVNARIQPFQAIVGGKQLDIMEWNIGERNKIARIYDAGLSKLADFVSIPRRPKNMREVYQLYLCLVKNRDGLLSHLQANGVDAKIHYPVPIHLQRPALAMGYKKGDFPEAERQADSIITLPCHQHLTTEQAEYVVQTISQFYA